MSEVKNTVKEKNAYSRNDGKPRYKVFAWLISWILSGGILGIQRFYMGKKDFYIYLLPMMICYFICGMFDIEDNGAIAMFFYLAAVFESFIILFLSDKKFNMICQTRKRWLEYKILFAKKENLDDIAEQYGIVVPVYEFKGDEKIKKAVKNYTDAIGLDRLLEENKTEEDIPIRVNNQISIQVVEPEVTPKKENDTVKDNYVNEGIHGSNIDDHEHIKEDKYLQKEINASQDRLEKYKNNDYFPSADYTPKVNKKERLAELKEELKSGLITKEEYNDEISRL